MVSDLLFAIREVNEGIHLQEENVVAGLCKWWGSIPCDPTLTENALAHFRLQCLSGCNRWEATVPEI